MGCLALGYFCTEHRDTCKGMRGVGYDSDEGWSMQFGPRGYLAGLVCIMCGTLQASRKPEDNERIQPTGPGQEFRCAYESNSIHTDSTVVALEWR
jgi:hypothetical protein